MVESARSHSLSSSALPSSSFFCRSESDLLSMLDHPNIVECKDVIRSPRQLVLVLEWLRCAPGLAAQRLLVVPVLVLLVLMWLRCALRLAAHRIEQSPAAQCKPRTRK